MHTLIAIDNSDASASIVDQIAARPWAKEARFTVLHVAEPAHLWTLGSTAAELARRSEAVVGHAVEKLKAAGLTVDGVEREGDPKSVILDYATEVRASRIVVGSRGASGVDRLAAWPHGFCAERPAPCGSFGKGCTGCRRKCWWLPTGHPAPSRPCDR
jgi:nucleotide-binding universal stress UspA family protein